jgi:glycosyltransferase involved in cell wall biosynthesis
VPSQWLETGPLVVMEAFDAGIPVIGSALGGISELVRDGVDGLLITPPTSTDAWRDILIDVCQNPDLIVRLRKGIRRQRHMSRVATEMTDIYRSCFVPAHGVPALR